MIVKHCHSSEGGHGRWWLKTKNGKATGRWGINCAWGPGGSYDVKSNTTGLKDDEVLEIIDKHDFQNGNLCNKGDHGWTTSEWDGVNLNAPA